MRIAAATHPSPVIITIIGKAFWDIGLARKDQSNREVKLPELVADIPEKVKGGKSFPHVVELNSQGAKQWQKDGSLEVEIESMRDGGDDGSITATRTVVLGFDRSGQAKVLKSTMKFATEKP